MQTDVCVYGGGAGGVTAAVEAARLGKSVALVVFNNHLGGMTTSGLGWTDLGKNGNAYIQGLALEFYTRIGMAYGGSAAQFTFEPHVAEAVFNNMVQGAGVTVYYNQQLATTTMSGQAISQIAMLSGNVFRAKEFIDASYEGDLLKQAGVSYATGREANSQYGETLNGIASPGSGNQMASGVDPYVTAGDSTSGLLPGVNASAGGSVGSADKHIQSYCYRLCLTSTSANRIALTAPPGYSESNYELLFRNIAAGQTGSFWSTNAMPNGKIDANNSGGVSLDLIGADDAYPEADYAARAQIALAHENWQRGFIYALQHSTRVPSTIRSAWAKWGLSADEFADNNYWPPQLYVRESRRMVSDYVMTQKNCTGGAVATDSVGLASYTMDSHNTQRIVSGGMVKNEGDVQQGVTAFYPVSYRSLVPKTGQCSNLLVPWCVASSHIAYASIRMEPVYMILGQSVGAAACIAIDDAVGVQNVAYPKLRAQLVSDGQALDTTATAAPAGSIVVDDADATGVSLTGAWTTSTATSGYYGSDYLHDGNTGQGTKSARFTPTLPTAGNYSVSIWYTTDANRATNVPVDIVSASGTTTVSVNQETNGAQWVSLGTYPFNAGTAGSVLIRNTGANGYVIADAVRFTSISATAATVSLWAANGSAAAFSDATGAVTPGWITVSRAGATDGDLAVNLAVGGTAVPGVDYATLPASVTIPSGSASVTVVITPQANFSTKGNTAVSVSLASGAGYTPGTLNAATVNIQAHPFTANVSRSLFVQKLAAGQPQTIVAYGTSLTYYNLWEPLLKSALDSDYPGLTTVVNSGGSGENSTWGVANLQSKVLAYRPDVVLIEFSTNDAFTNYANSSPPKAAGYQTTLAQAKANLLTMIDNIRSVLPQCEIILQVMNPVINVNNTNATYRPNLQAFQQNYRDVAAARGLEIVDHMPAWQALLDQGASAYAAYVTDGLHPTAAGYQKYMVPTLVQALGVGSPPSLIVDNAASSGVTKIGTWTADTATPGYYGTNQITDGNANKGGASVRFTPTFTAAGNYPLYLRWTAGSNRATNVPVDIVDATGATTTLVFNQQFNGGQWVPLGTYTFNAGTGGSVTVRNTGTNGTVIADAVGADVPSTALPAVSLRAANGLAAEPLSSAGLPRTSALTVSRTGTTTNALTVNWTVGGTASNGADYTALPASLTIPAGASSASVVLTPLADNLAEGDETVQVGLLANSAYTLTTPSAATVTIQDRPTDAWRYSHFTAQQLSNPGSPTYPGDLVDTDGDGLPNLLEAFFNSDPNGFSASGLPTLSQTTINGSRYLTLSYTCVDFSDLASAVEVSSDPSDPAGWQSGNAFVEMTVLSDDGVTRTVTARDLQPIQSGPRQFMRVRVTRAP